MTEFFKHIQSLRGAQLLDRTWLKDYQEEMEGAIPEIVRIEEEQRLLAAESRLYSVGRFVPRED